ncbi:hypothetical protein IHQ71_30510 (plasmid) [Rhizobium sp. TH2]|uniref:hypothetical protein n=1 Tax=Rhizobium sp. TH2 TaxID=2775403 RepID=UPI0021583B6B|nr:hypothetical protein [Rhizobium sp. TH2]UVC12349.1 hypothetical protein IHQ71_30510 [Rhizobium sp. TH2]
MQSSFVVIWLLVSSLIFIYFSKTFDHENPRQAAWLLVLATAWPLLAAYLAIGAVFMLVCLPAPRNGKN